MDIPCSCPDFSRHCFPVWSKIKFSASGGAYGIPLYGIFIYLKKNYLMAEKRFEKSFHT
jgi:hypothetical protein